VATFIPKFVVFLIIVVVGWIGEAENTALTGAALATTAYGGLLGVRLSRAGDVPSEGGTVPGDATPEQIARTLQRQRVLQWITPVLTGALVVLGAQQGEQQRPGQ
jgi:hypothetical protein